MPPLLLPRVQPAPLKKRAPDPSLTLLRIQKIRNLFVCPRLISAISTSDFRGIIEKPINLIKSLFLGVKFLA